MSDTKISVNYFDSIAVSIPYDKIYSRLGYARGVTELGTQQSRSTHTSIQEAVEFISLQAATVRLSIGTLNESEVIFTSGLQFKSIDVSHFLQGCDEALLMGATTGKEIMHKIDCLKNNDMTKSVIFDAVASELVDQALNWIMHYYAQLLRRENRELTQRRYSAGYGDFSLDTQKSICDTLALGRLGVTLTASYMLLPQKSVTAVAGIKKVIP